MSKHAILNNVEHKNLKVITTSSAVFGDDVMYTHIYPFEFRHVQADYPIVFAKDDKQNFFALALFGFSEKENLYLKEQENGKVYLPILQQRGPFYIGFQQDSNNPSADKKMVISIDTANPRVSETDGESLFLPHGGHSDYTDHIITILKAMHDGQAINQSFMQLLEKNNLLESFNIDITLENQETHRLAGFYTINESVLAELPSDVVAEMNKTGALQAIYMTLASMSNIPKLIDRKNTSLKGLS